MGSKVSSDAAVNFTKNSVYLAFSWPPPVSATESQKTYFYALWNLSFLSAMALFLPLLAAIYEFQEDSLTLTKTACHLGAVAGYVIKIVVCRLHRERIQESIFKMEHFLRYADQHEQSVLQSYVDEYSMVHAAITIINYLTPIFVISGPLFMSGEEFPTTAVYPFSVETGLIKYLVYIHQSIVGFQCAAGATVDCQMGLLIWVAGAKLEILASKLTQIRQPTELYLFVQEHQRWLRFAKEVTITMSYIAFTTTTTSGLVTIFSCLQLIGNEPFAVKMQFGPVALISIACLFVCAWPSDNLITVNGMSGQCDFIATAAYNSPWVAMSPKMRRNVLIILRRAQRPVVASIGGFIPALSLRYYGSFLSTAFSYFTTLRVIMTMDKP